MILFELICICTLWNLGIEIVFSDGMALQNVRKWAESKHGKWYEVLFYCLWCRPSVHSIFGFMAAWWLGIIDLLQWRNFILYPFVVAGTSLASGIIWSIYKLIEVKILYYKHKEQNEYFDLKDRKIEHFKNKKI